MAGPLEGIRICDLSVLTAGGEATGFLCDLGAEVVKVEPPGGEVGRRVTALAAGASTFFLPQNRGKKSIVVDLRKPGGREIIRRLAARSDVFVHNYRPGTVERLGLTYEDIQAVNPAVIYGESTGFGGLGPDATQGSVDIIGQARGGLISVTGEEYPVPAGFIVSDYLAAMHLAIGVLAALQHRNTTGQGQKVEGSMLGSLINAQGWEMTHYLVTGQKPKRGGRGHQLFGPTWAVFQTADGHVTFSGITPVKLQEMARLLEAPELAEPALVESMRQRGGSALADALRDVFAVRTTAAICAALRALGVHCSPVQDYEAVANDPQVLANDYIVPIDHPRFGRTRMTGNPLRFSETPIELAAAAPELGGETDEVLALAGYGESEIADLRTAGVVA